jgi:ABC-2 type transport system ATP-binding protein
VCDRIGIIREGRLVELEDVASLIDRSGKTVRANIGGSVTAAEFEIEGAHDVTVSGGPEPTGSPESPEPASDTTAPDDAATVDDTAVPDDAPEMDGSEETTSVSFTYTGAYEPLLSHLLEYELLDLAIEEAPLEDVFMRFYGDHDAQAVVERVENGVDERGGGEEGPGDEHDETQDAETADV